MKSPYAESGWFGQHPRKIVPNQAAEIGESDETKVPGGAADKVRLSFLPYAADKRRSRPLEMWLRTYLAGFTLPQQHRRLSASSDTPKGRLPVGGSCRATTIPALRIFVVVP